MSAGHKVRVGHGAGIGHVATRATVWARDMVRREPLRASGCYPHPDARRSVFKSTIVLTKENFNHISFHDEISKIRQTNITENKQQTPLICHSNKFTMAQLVPTLTMLFDEHELIQYVIECLVWEVNSF
jgi:hypothetical protein